MATTAHPRLDKMIAVSKDSKIAPLGYIVWFSVPDESVPVRRLKRIWQLAGLDPHPLPKDPRAVNVFKRAVREQEKVGTFVDPKTGYKVETDVRDLLENEDDVIYEVSRVTRDPDTGVEYPKAVRVWFSKPYVDPKTGKEVGGEIGFKALGGLPRKDVLPIMESIQAEFDANGSRVTGPKVRTLVRSYVKNDFDEGDRDPDSGKVTGYSVGLSGENLRGKAGGVYFVLAKYREQIDALSEFLDELYEPHGRAYLYAVPLADGKSEREMIRARHVSNCIAEMEREMGDVRELLQGGRSREVRSNVAAHHWRELEKLRRRAAQYGEALKSEQEDLQAHLDILNGQLRKLI